MGNKRGYAGLELEEGPKRRKVDDGDSDTSPCSSSVSSPVKSVKSEPCTAIDTRKGYMLPIEKINQHITCPVCKGYLIDATTIVECLHTFCKSCLLAHFENGYKHCPKCEQIIHQSHPLHYVAFDRTMQDIVYKLVPDLLNNEKNRRKEFRAKRRGNGGGGAVAPSGSGDASSKTSSEGNEAAIYKCFPHLEPKHSHHRLDDQVVVRLIPEKGLESISRPVIRTSHQTTVNTLKRYLARLIWNDASKYHRLDMHCNGELMGKDYSMRFIQITQWRHQKFTIPIALTYRPHIEF